jgi:hypothetical protein
MSNVGLRHKDVECFAWTFDVTQMKILAVLLTDRTLIK